MTWEYYSDDALVFSGTGRMSKYNADNIPWADYRDQIRTVIINGGVTSIGGCAFYFCALTSVTISDSVASIGQYAFFLCQRLSRATIGSGVASVGDSAFYRCDKLTCCYTG